MINRTKMKIVCKRMPIKGVMLDGNPSLEIDYNHNVEVVPNEDITELMDIEPNADNVQKYSTMLSTYNDKLKTLHAKILKGHGEGFIILKYLI